MTSPSNSAQRPPADPNAENPSRVSRTGRSFFIGLLSIALMLLIAGIGAFWYLTANGPLALLSRSDRPIATATAFVPANAPFSVSLLANPDKLVARQQALPDADAQQVLEAAQQIEQSLFQGSSIDYDRDIRPWLGDEVTIACIQADLDFDDTNGKQSGYLLALAIAPEKSQQAKESLQLFWQKQSLSGNRLQSEQLNGVRLLYSRQTARSGQPLSNPFQQLGAASALVGNQFVLFANDAQVIRRSLRATETATNLAQNRAYRVAADQLPSERLGLARVMGAAFANGQQSKSSSSNFATLSLELVPTGLMATGLVVDTQLLAITQNNSTLAQSASDLSDGTTSLLKFIPADSAIALTGQNLSQLEPAITANGLPITLPDFLKLTFPDTDEDVSNRRTPWDWVKGEYAIAQNKSDWILVVERTEDGVAQMDALAKSLGYNTVPLTIGEREAIAWTKFKARTQRRQSTTLETEILGLHLQQSDSNDDLLERPAGDYEIFASSIAAMDDALSASEKPLLSDPSVVQSIAVMEGDQMDSGQDAYLYMDWPAVASALNQRPALKSILSTLRPITSQFDTLTATKLDDTVRLFVQFKQPRPVKRTAPRRP